MQTKGLKVRLVRTGLKVSKFELAQRTRWSYNYLAGGHVCLFPINTNLHFNLEDTILRDVLHQQMTITFPVTQRNFAGKSQLFK